MKEIFIGKPLHWLIWIVVGVVLYLLGSMKLHVQSFVPFMFAVLALAAGAVLLVILTYRKGDRITREPFDDAGNQ